MVRPEVDLDRKGLSILPHLEPVEEEGGEDELVVGLSGWDMKTVWNESSEGGGGRRDERDCG